MRDTKDDLALLHMADTISVQEVKDWKPEETGSEVKILVCNPAHWHTPFDDNEFTHCDMCECIVYHRPHVPAGLTPVCVPCAIAMMHEQKAAGEDCAVVMTPKTADEVKTFLKRHDN